MTKGEVVLECKSISESDLQTVLPKWRCFTVNVKEFLLQQTKCKRNRLKHQFSARPEYQGLFLSPAKRLVSTDRDLPTNLTQSCKPAAVGMFAYSGSVNICFYRMGPYSPEDNFKQLFANYKHACTANYSICVQESKPAEGERT